MTYSDSGLLTSLEGPEGFLHIKHTPLLNEWLNTCFVRKLPSRMTALDWHLNARDSAGWVLIRARELELKK